MKKIALLTTIGAMVAFGASRLNAQSTNTNTVTFTTNIVQTVTITLTGFEQTGGSNSTSVSPVRIGTKQILEDLGTASGTHFSSRAKLIAVTPLGGGSTAFMVQDGNGTNAQTDVSSFFTATTVGTPVTRSHTNARGKTTGQQYSIESFGYGATDTNGTATTGYTLTGLQGFTTTQLANGAFNSQVNGPGTHSGDAIVVKGNINGGPGKFQTVQSQ